MAPDGSADALYHYGISSDLAPEFSLPAARDLSRIGQAAFLADRAFRRGQRLGQRTRDLRVVVPVEDTKLWSSLAEPITGLAGFVSQDRWQFEFVRQRTVAEGKRVSPRVSANACISLFSGGLDSLCGAAAAMRRGDTPIFVTHAPPGTERVAASVAKLREALDLKGPCRISWDSSFRRATAQGRASEASTQSGRGARDRCSTYAWRGLWRWSTAWPEFTLMRMGCWQ